ncbi:Putative E3 ubiquitin-protein ligase [Arachis hypogaea]|nr:Putative E3 ubiquitin-protein ligase [Arachis hypogaea]
MINRVAFDEDKQKYSRYLLRSYIEDNKKYATGSEEVVEAHGKCNGAGLVYSSWVLNVTCSVSCSMQQCDAYYHKEKSGSWIYI